MASITIWERCSLAIATIRLAYSPKNYVRPLAAQGKLARSLLAELLQASGLFLESPHLCGEGRAVEIEIGFEGFSLPVNQGRRSELGRTTVDAEESLGSTLAEA